MTVESHAINQWADGVKTPRPRHQEVSPGAFATLQNLSLLEWALLMRDNRYQQTALGPSVVEFLTYMKLGGKAERTLEQYEHDLARGCLLYPEVSLKAMGRHGNAARRRLLQGQGAASPGRRLALVLQVGAAAAAWSTATPATGCRR